MRITSLHLQNFKRFTDLRIEGIPETAKLVLLIGANGSGKSSVFDAFEVMNRLRRNTLPVYFHDPYYRKNIDQPIIISASSGENSFTLSDGSKSSDVTNIQSFYGRTSFRQISRLLRNNLGPVHFDILQDSDRANFFIDRDERFENDIEHLSGEILKQLFRTTDSNAEVKQRYIQPINNALERIFLPTNPNAIQLLEIIPPIEGKVAQITFRKGASEFHYNQLSAGEKEIFNVLINLLARTRDMGPTLFFMDELDLHLNTQLQYFFLKEITEHWIPDDSQLWTATHSLGFIDYARKCEAAAIIDFDALDFDQAHTIMPTPAEDFDVFEVAVSGELLRELFDTKTIVFAENTDAALYNNLSFPKHIFIKANDKLSVFHKAEQLQTLGIIDRDYLSDEERATLLATYPWLRILPYYSSENLLYHPDNLEEYFATQGKDFDKEDYIAQLLACKKAALSDLLVGLMNARNGYPFYKENKHAEQLKAFKERPLGVQQLLESDDFETFYKVFPAKDYGKTIPQRQNLSKTDLAGTSWFKSVVERVLHEN